MARRRQSSGVARLGAIVLLLAVVALVIVSGLGNASGFRVTPPNAEELAAIKASLSEAIQQEQIAVSLLGKGEELAARVALGTGSRELDQAAETNDGYQESPNYVADWMSSAITTDGVALETIDSFGIRKSSTRNGLISAVESAIGEKQASLQVFQHYSVSSQASSGGGQTGASGECKAAPGGSCTITPAAPRATVDAPGRGTVEIRDEHTGRTNSYRAPSTFPITDVADDPLEFFNKTSQPATITAGSTGGAGTSSEQPQSCVDILRGSAGPVADVAVDDVAAAGDPATITFTAPGSERTLSLTLNAQGEATGETPVPVASEIEITVKVTVSPTLTPLTNTYEAREDGEFSFTSIPTATPTSTSSTPATSTSTSATGSSSSSPGCAVVHSQQSCSFTATGATIVLAGTGKGALLIENLITKQGSSFPAPTTGATFTPIPGDQYIVRNYSNADMTVRQ